VHLCEQFGVSGRRAFGSWASPASSSDSPHQSRATRSSPCGHPARLRPPATPLGLAPENMGRPRRPAGG
jgi:hypothetical protein